MGKFGGKKKFGNDRGFRSGNRSDRPAMHDAVCSECGRDCEVPFRPTGDKPVYCSECFGKKESDGNNRFERRGSGRSDFSEKRSYRAVCDSCHEECEVPFRPSGDKPVYCNECFGRSEKSGGGVKNEIDHNQFKKQFETLNSKLDYILKLLSKKNTAETVEVSEGPILEKKVIVIEEKPSTEEVKPDNKEKVSKKSKKLIKKKPETTKKAVKKTVKKATTKKTAAKKVK